MESTLSSSYASSDFSDDGDFPEPFGIRHLTENLGDADLTYMASGVFSHGLILPSPTASWDASSLLDDGDGHFYRRETSISESSSSLDSDIPLAITRPVISTEDQDLDKSDRKKLLPSAEINLPAPKTRKPTDKAKATAKKTKPIRKPKSKSKSNCRAPSSKPRAKKVAASPPIPSSPKKPRRCSTPPPKPATNRHLPSTPPARRPEARLVTPPGPPSPAISILSGDDEEDRCAEDEEYLPTPTPKMTPPRATKKGSTVARGKRAPVGRYGPERRSQNMTSQKRYRDRQKAEGDFYRVSWMEIKRIVQSRESADFEEAVRASVASSLARLKIISPQTARAIDLESPSHFTRVTGSNSKLPYYMPVSLHQATLPL